MKYLLFVCMLFAFATVAKAQSYIDTVVYEVWDGTTWKIRNRNIYTYDENCRKKTQLTQSWSILSGIWTDATLTTYAYAIDDYFSKVDIQNWNSFLNKWENYRRDTYSYDASFKILELKYENWTGNSWEIFFRVSYDYDANGYLDSMLTETSFAGPFQNTNLSIYKMNIDGTINNKINNNWDAVNSEWVKYSKDYFTYNLDKSIQTSKSDIWNDTDQAWEDQFKNIYTYYAPGVVETLQGYRWQNNQWENMSYLINAYNARGELINILNQLWSTTLKDWENYTQQNYIRNIDGTIKEWTVQNWSSYDMKWENVEHDIYSYKTGCLLPLNLLSFTAQEENNLALLNWQTTEEKNTAYFNVQQSLDGKNFITHGNVVAQSAMQVINNYKFTDNIENINAGQIFYRLQMVDKDGLSSFSDVIPLNITSQSNNIKLYPNPVKQQLFISLGMQNTGKTQIQIVDMNGKVLSKQYINNTNVIPITVSNLSKGAYYVLAITDNGIQKSLFMKE